MFCRMSLSEYEYVEGVMAAEGGGPLTKNEYWIIAQCIECDMFFFIG
jgi:hypothetical protein